MKISNEFYQRNDVVQISKDLLGKKLVTCIDGVRTSGIITETEAYCAPEDKASHAYNGKRTPRTEIFYHEGGVAYVYLCYGMHHLFNIITSRKDVPHAILIRAIEPLEGIDTMLLRRNKTKLDKTLTTGPGSMSKALGISHTLHNGVNLQEELIWVEDGPVLEEKLIVAGPRIGVQYAQEYAAKPWRFWIKGSAWISKGK